MTIKNRNNYLEALGIPGFFYSQSDSEKKVIPEVECLIIETTSQDSFCEPGESQDLLIKILTSIDLTLSNVCLMSIEKDNLDECIRANPAKAVLVMGSEVNSDLSFLFSTHHPRDILKNDKLKREVWEVLKKVELCLR